MFLYLSRHANTYIHIPSYQHYNVKCSTILVHIYAPECGSTILISRVQQLYSVKDQCVEINTARVLLQLGHCIRLLVYTRAQVHTVYIYIRVYT